MDSNRISRARAELRVIACDRNACAVFDDAGGGAVRLVRFGRCVPPDARCTPAIGPHPARRAGAPRERKRLSLRVSMTAAVAVAAVTLSAPTSASARSSPRSRWPTRTSPRLRQSAAEARLSLHGGDSIRLRSLPAIAALAAFGPGTASASISHDCGIVAFAPRSDNGAFYIKARGTTCSIARAVARASRPSHFSRGDAIYTSHRFRCLGQGSDLGGVGKYVVKFECYRGRSGVSFLRG